MRRYVAFLFLCLPLLARGAEPEDSEKGIHPEERAQMNLKGGGRVEYEIRHRLHTVQGVSKDVEVRAVSGPKGLQVMGRAPVRSFDSGNSNRDKHVLEVVRANLHPYVIVRALAPEFRLPEPGSSSTILLRSQVELGGVASTPAFNADLKREKDGRLRVDFSFEDRLTDHEIERPKLLLIPVSDEFSVRGELVLEIGDESEDSA